MMSGWIFVILSASTSILIAHFLKQSESRKLNTIRVLTVNYLVASAVALTVSIYIGGDVVNSDQMIQPILLAGVVGVIFIANFYFYSKSVFHNGVGISIAAMRISLIIPVLLSTIWYLEFLSPYQWLGVFLVFTTLFLLLPRKKSIEFELKKETGWLLLLLFLGTGVGDASLKVFESEFSDIMGKELFMGSVFLTAFIIGLLTLLIRRELQFTLNEIKLGIAIGIPNLLTSIFLIMALERMSGAVVYSSVNVLTVLGGTLIGIIFWKDHFTKTQWIGILLTVVSILLLIQ